MLDLCPKRVYVDLATSTLTTEDGQTPAGTDPLLAVPDVRQNIRKGRQTVMVKGKGKATSVNNAIPIVDEVNVTSFDGQTFTIYHPKSRPSGRALMACWLASSKRLELRQAAQAGTFSKLACWQLTDDLRAATNLPGASTARFDKAVKRAIASKHGITAAIQTPKASKAGKATPTFSKENNAAWLARTLKGAGFTPAEVAKAVKAAL